MAFLEAGNLFAMKRFTRTANNRRKRRIGITIDASILVLTPNYFDSPAL